MPCIASDCAGNESNLVSISKSPPGAAWSSRGAVFAPLQRSCDEPAGTDSAACAPFDVSSESPFGSTNDQRVVSTEGELNSSELNMSGHGIETKVRSPDRDSLPE